MTRPRGYILNEILLVIMLTGLFGIVSMQLLRTNFQVAHATFTADNNSATFDGAVMSLRADIASAESIEMTDPQTLQIHQSGDHTIDWRTDAVRLSRSDKKDVHLFAIGQPMNLKIDGAIVLLSATADPLNAIAIEIPARGK